MANVKIRFSIEVDSELLIEHQIEQVKAESFQAERELAEEVINKLNTFILKHMCIAKTGGI